jgi:carboxypeptidase C (cathepsin A)
MRKLSYSLAIFAFCTCQIFAVNDANENKAAATKAVQSARKELSAKQHTLELPSGKIQYKSIAGFLPVLNELNKTEGYMFFTAYFKIPENSANRPIVFAFNGGPGSSSVWLHMGCLGPKRIVLENDANVSPYALRENQYSWLDIADIVLIDPIGTGFSFAADPNEENSFFEVKKDVSSVASFIRMFLTKYQKWGCPKYLVGESYGTLRAIGLLDYLPETYGIQIDGVVLISSALNFETISLSGSSDLPYSLYLPTYAAAAFYHKKLNKDLQNNFEKTIEQARQWANNEYIVLLAKGDLLTDKEKNELSQNIQRYTGLSPEFIKNNNYRIDVFSFITELLKDKGLQLGLMDSRITGLAVPPNSNYYDDHSFTILKTIYVTGFNEYLAKDLDFNSVLPYKSLSMTANRKWQWGSAEKGFVDFTDDLVKAVIRNPKLKIFAAMGYYDLTTPFATQEYTIDHLGMTEKQRQNIRYYHYFSGHQVYANEDNLAKFKNDITKFLKD